MTPSLSHALELDAADPLRGFRERFALPEGVIYLDGNSLGALPKETVGRMEAIVTREWGDGLIRSWNAADWIGAPARIGAALAPLVGAAADEVIVADSTSVNLFKLLAAFRMAEPSRTTILSEAGNFPTDLYIAEGLAGLVPGLRLETAARDDLVAAAGPGTIALLSHVDYRSGARHDLAGMTAALQAKGARVVWDLSHSVGALEIDLAAAGADAAVGCGYKYLNGGPGAPAFLYLAERNHPALRSPLAGWMGHAAPFDFAGGYRPAPGVARFLCGTPPMLAIAALEGGVLLAGEAPMATVEAKAGALGDFFVAAVEHLCERIGVDLRSPRDARGRGAHVSFGHPQAYPVMQALIARGVIGDVREPDLLRFGFAPLYVSFADTWRAAEALRTVLAAGEWRKPQHQRRALVP